MAANKRNLEKGLVLRMELTSSENWYETMGGTTLHGTDKDDFDSAFQTLVAGSYNRAFREFGRLSAKGSIISQYYLGLMYLKGMGTLQDYGRAHLWLNIASSKGHKKSRKQLEKLTKKMTANQVSEAQKLAQAWAKKYRKAS